ncbi:hypothetical protein M5D96_007199 [Drosophila gunungcola]|uniref:Uncharacterized protein n=1 Tax=Drosophila gunungcola TaxID=103775 RepID=A0A9P9YMJ3_9MUSC|nr:hypothetical protein M5D96_007199 [Drosophila gunungcola]
MIKLLRLHRLGQILGCLGHGCDFRVDNRAVGDESVLSRRVEDLHFLAEVVDVLVGALHLQSLLVGALVHHRSLLVALGSICRLVHGVIAAIHSLVGLGLQDGHWLAFGFHGQSMTTGDHHGQNEKWKLLEIGMLGP